ncbi:hypothetical protein Lal_00039734 [Lupinus albus]|nr:hypothetical protein Lal_00039734 [Lupinus albus]
MVGMRKDPKVGGGVGGTCEVTRNQTQHSPKNENLLLANPEGCSYFGSSDAAKKMNFKMIDVEVFHKMSFSNDPHDHRTYKHRTDRPTAPPNQPEPANPNPFEFNVNLPHLPPCLQIR